MALIGTLANAFGARWFDERWQPEFSGGEWKKALDFYVSTLKRYGPPGASSNGFNENLALFNSGKCAIWVDASVAGSFVTDKSQSKVADATGFAFAPGSHRQGRLLAVFLGPGDSRQLARQGRGEGLRHLGHLAGVRQAGGGQEGVANVPPGTRASTYSEASGRRAVRAGHPESLKRVDPNHPTLKPVPYVGIQLVTIPEFQAIGTQVGKLFSAALTGQMSSDQALAAAQQSTAREMKRAGYPK